ncbi:MAG: protein-glutamate O-methyltransferase CheR [Aquabacterium sp.]
MHPTLSDKEFQAFQKMIFDLAGIHMSEAKKPLVCGRLAKRLNQHGLDSYSAYFQLVQRDEAERQAALDLLTTNETYFFREPKHFEFLANVLAPTLREQSMVRIWCGACSSGEEPYTIAMVLAEALGHTRFEILASDISSRVLHTARKALYPIEDAANIPRPMRAKYCLRGIGSQDGWFTLDRLIRDRVHFDTINLNERLPDIGPFDVIFLRNVMIYFSPDTKKQVLARMVPLIRPGGHFIISHSESLHGITDALQMVKPSLYCRRSD